MTRAAGVADIRLRGIEVLPQSLSEAVDALQADEVICNALGDTLCEQFCQLKREEWTEFARHVSGWETARYGAMF